MMTSKFTHMLDLQEVSSSYGAVEALHDVSLYVDEGEVVSLIGSNGAGKSTLLMTIFGTPAASRGNIFFEGKQLRGVATHNISRHGIALVPEGRRIFPGMTVEENLIMGAVSLSAKDIEDVEKIYELFPRLKERSRQRGGTLSGGEQQMLAIGRGLMARPRLLLLDEPSLGLAPLMVKQIFNIIKKIAKSGTTILLVEQNANHALKIADRGYVLMNGRIKMSGTGEQLRNDHEIRNAYLGGG